MKKITLELSDESYEKLLELQEQDDDTSVENVIYKSLTIYNWWLENTSSHDFLLQHKDTKKIHAVRFELS